MIKPADTIQVKQIDGAQSNWIYAKVITANADGSALVLVSHPLNRDHGQQLMCRADEIRTKADIETEIAALGKDMSPAGRQQLRSLESQADWLS